MVAIVGSGYVGLVAGACLAETGNDVVCADVDAAKDRTALRRNDIPIYEPGLEPMVRRNQAGRPAARSPPMSAPRSSTARSSSSRWALRPARTAPPICSTCCAVASTIGQHMNEPKVVITKSTVPVGTAERCARRSGAETRSPFHVCSNPEFLKEGAAIDDFMKPDRVVVGVDQRGRPGRAWQSCTPPSCAPAIRSSSWTSPSAEVTKYAANAMLATRISFMNQIAEFCERVGADVTAVRAGHRHRPPHRAGLSVPRTRVRRSCFPKDVKALIRSAQDMGMELDLLEAVEAVNAAPEAGAARTSSRQRLGADLSGQTVAVWGLAFKAETDDMRESPAHPADRRARSRRGAGCRPTTPRPWIVAREVFGSGITYARDPYDALQDADALVIVTEWLVYRNPDFERLQAALKQPVIFDGRNLFDPDRHARTGFDYRRHRKEPLHEDARLPAPPGSSDRTSWTGSWPRDTRWSGSTT